MSHRKTAPMMLAALLLLAGCDRERDVPPPPAEAPAQGDAVSIIRDDVRAEMPARDEETQAPRRLVVGFPDGGAALDAEAEAALSDFLSPDWVRGEALVRLWGHSDTIGSDAANFRAGEARARAVADYLEVNGVDPTRITIVSLGEGNPARPNFLPDGSDDEEGQRANRRVEIEVGEAQRGGAEAPAISGDVERVKGIEPSS